MHEMIKKVDADGLASFFSAGMSNFVASDLIVLQANGVCSSTSKFVISIGAKQEQELRACWKVQDRRAKKEFH